MSGLVKGVKKVFKKVGKFVKKYWKPIAAAVAIYFTAGVALSYFGSTASFASSLPGFGSGGIFSKAAVWMGFNGAAGSGLYQTAAAAGKIAGTAVGGVGSGVATQTVSGGAGVGGAGIGIPGTGIGVGNAGSTFAMPGSVTAAAQAASQTVTPLATAGVTAGAGPTTSTATDALIKALNTTTKLSMIKMGVDTISGLLAPDPYEEARKMHALQNASAFGVGRDGDDTFGWGNSDVASMWSGMNKREGAAGHGSGVGYGKSSDQSQFRDTQFLATPVEQNNPHAHMGQPVPESQQFIQQGYAQRRYGTSG